MTPSTGQITVCTEATPRETRAQRDAYARARAVHRTQLAESFQRIFGCRLEPPDSTNAKVETIHVTHRHRTSVQPRHRKQRRRQRPMVSLAPQHRSTSGFHGAPAHRQSAREAVDHVPPPRKSQRPMKRQPHGGAVAVERRQCWPLGTPPTTTDAAAWRQVQHKPQPGSSALARPRATNAADPCSISAFG